MRLEGEDGAKKKICMAWGFFIFSLSILASMPPSIRFEPSHPTVGSPVKFTAVGFSSKKCILWDFGDGKIEKDLSPPVIYHTYTRPGVYTVKAYDACRPKLTAYIRIKVSRKRSLLAPIFPPAKKEEEKPVKPKVYFPELKERKIQFTPKRPRAGERIVFKAINFRSPCVKWNFGDGTVRTGKRVEHHVFVEEGLYVVEAYERCGLSKEKAVVKIRVLPPSKLVLQKVNLQFEDGSKYKVVTLDFPALRAVAEILCKGRGRLTYKWIVDGKELERGSLRIRKPTKKKIFSPPLPTSAIGTYMVEFAASPEPKEMPTAFLRYSVKGIAGRLSLSGRAINKYTGSPIAAAKIRLNVILPFKKREKRTYTQITDRQGNFSFRDLPLNIRYQLEAEASGMLPYKGKWKRARTENIEDEIIEMSPSGLTLTGTVIEEDSLKPVENIPVLLLIRPVKKLSPILSIPLQPILMVKDTEEGGRFKFENLPLFASAQLRIDYWRYRPLSLNFKLSPEKAPLYLGKIKLKLRTGSIKVSIAKKRLLREKCEISLFRPNFLILKEATPIRSCQLGQQLLSCILRDIPLNDPLNPLDFYVLRTFCPYHQPVNLTVKLTEEATKKILVVLKERRPWIYGLVQDELTGKPIRRAKIRFFRKKETGEDLITSTFSNSKGKYFLTNLDLKEGQSYFLLITKNGYRPKRIPLKLSDFSPTLAYLKLITKLSPFTAIVKGRIEDEEARPLKDVFIKVKGSDSFASSDRLGNFQIRAYLPLKEGLTIAGITPAVILEFYKRGFEKLSKAVSLKPDEERDLGTIVLKRRKGKLSVKVVRQFKLTGANIRKKLESPLANIEVRVEFQGKSLSSLTNLRGEAIFKDLPLEEELLISLKDPKGFYAPAKATVVLYTKEEKIQLAMSPAAVVSGYVKDQLSMEAIRDATIEVEGSPFSTRSDENGFFQLKGVPSGYVTFKVTAAGYYTAIKKVEVKEGKQKQIQILMKKAAVETIYGFKVAIEKEEVLENGNRKLWGWLVDIPSQPLNPDGKLKLHFSELEVDPSFRPLKGKVPLDHDEIPVKLFNWIDALFIPDKISTFEARWDSRRSTGYIAGKLLLFTGAQRRRLTSTYWPNEVSTKLETLNEAPALYSKWDNLWPIKFNINPVGEKKVRLWNYTLHINYPESYVDEKGFHYKGHIVTEGLPNIKFDSLVFGKEGAPVFENLHFEKPLTSRGFSIDFKKLEIKDERLYWEGKAEIFKLKTSADSPFTLYFRDAYISPYSEILSDNLQWEDSDLYYYGRKLELEEGRLRGWRDRISFIFSGRLHLEKIAPPVVLEKLQVNSDGNLLVEPQSPAKYNFSRIADIQIIKFKKKEQCLVADSILELGLPFFSALPADLHYCRNKPFYMDKFHWETSLPVAHISLEGGFDSEKNYFYGTGKFYLVEDYGGQINFQYAGSSNWSLTLVENVPIEICGFITLSEGRGRFGVEGGSWFITLGGNLRFTFIPEDVLYGSVDLTVRAGPSIEGVGELTVFRILKPSQTRLLIDLDRMMVLGEAKFQINSFGLYINELNAQLKIDRSSFLFEGRQRFKLFNLISEAAYVLIGFNHYVEREILTELGINRAPFFRLVEGPINGILVANSSHSQLNASIFEFFLDEGALLKINLHPYQFAGAFALKGRARASLDLKGFSIGVGGEVEGAAAINLSEQGYWFDLDATGRVKGWAGCCSGEGCDPVDVCFKWFIPCGPEMCFSLGLKAHYSDVRGWDFDVTCLFCD